MKKYIRPKIHIELLEEADIVCTSFEYGEDNNGKANNGANLSRHRNNIWDECIAIVVTLSIATSVSARTFQHPGITYTEADIQRMRTMVEAQVEPYYTTFEAFSSSKYITSNPALNSSTELETFSGTVGKSGRQALDLALLWRLTDNTEYADKAVQILNSYNIVTNCTNATAALEIGKINLLIEAAELMRDYSGWTKSDQAKFKAMLVHPGYSQTVVPSGEKTFYWNVYNFDRGRFGNQGLNGARALMAMAIYLDNEVMYDRAYRYLTGQSHRSDDLAYPMGAPVQRNQIESTGSHESASDSYMNVFASPNNYGTIEDYGYDEQIQYYIYPNGQCQESSRDQGHVTFGLNVLGNIAEMAWNQGDDLYGFLDSRILLGMEWTYRYIQSYVEEDVETWSPAGFVEYNNTMGATTSASFDNNQYIQTLSRSARWYSLTPYDGDRDDTYAAGAMREAALAHYSVRAGLNADRYYWLQKSRDYMIANYHYESWGKIKNNADNWYYEFPGWGTLTKRRTPWMAGDAVTFSGKEAQFSTHPIGDEILFADYDAYAIAGAGQGHNYCSANSELNTIYRTDGHVKIEILEMPVIGYGGYADNSENLAPRRASGHNTDVSIYGLTIGDWQNYTITNTSTTNTPCDVFVTYSSTDNAVIKFITETGDDLTATLPATDEDVFVRINIGRLNIAAGVSVVRVVSISDVDELRLLSFSLEKPAETMEYILNVSQTAGVSTLILPFDAALPQGLEAYTLEDMGTYIKATPASSITADQPVIVKGSGTYSLNGTITGNMNISHQEGSLIGVYATTTITEGNYVLQKHSGYDAAFYRVSEGSNTSISPYRCYLKASGSSQQNAKSILFEDGSGITTITKDAINDEIIYDLQGFRSTSNKGFQIRNGRIIGFVK